MDSGKEKSMCSKIIVVILSAVATLATVSIASAQNDQRVSDRPRATTNAPAAAKNAATKDATSLTTLEQEIAMPYRPCINARGWVNGRLVCGDN
jgi:hypothetical protein